MKAMVIKAYGASDVLECADIDIPKIGDSQLLVEVHAAGVNPFDWKIRKGMMRFIMSRKFPKVLGSDVAGIVSKAGRNVHGFKTGDTVFGMINFIFNQGGYAEYAVVSEKYAAIKPGNLSFIEAAAVPGSAVTALQVLRDKVRLRTGKRILINGASGGVGTFAIQIAKIFGAHVTGVCSGRNLELVSSLGADHVIDYTKTDFLNANERYDVVFDTVGNREFSDFKRILFPTGLYVTIVPSVKIILLNLIAPLFPGKKCRFVSSRPSSKDLSWLKDMIEEGRIRPVVDRVYPLEKAREAHDYIETRHARGKVVLNVIRNRSHDYKLQSPQENLF